MSAPVLQQEQWYGYSTGQRLVTNQPYYANVQATTYAQAQGSVLANAQAPPHPYVYFTQGPGLACFPLLESTATTDAPYVWIPEGADESRPLTIAAFHPVGAFVAVADSRLDAQVSLYTWPERRLVQKVDQTFRLSVAAMAWSRKGTHFAILSGAPLHNLTIYTVDVESGQLEEVVASQGSQANTHQFTSVSFNPRNNMDLCVSGGGHIAFWRIEGSVDDPPTDAGRPSLEGVEGSLSTPGSWRITCHSWTTLPDNSIVAGTTSGRLFLFNVTTGVGSLAPFFDATDASEEKDAADDNDALLSITDIILTKHSMVSLSAGGTLHFYTHDIAQEIRRIDLSLASAASSLAFTAHDTFVVGTTGGSLTTVVLPGYNLQGAAGGALSTEELRLLAPRIRVLVEGFGCDVVSACTLSALTDDTFLVAGLSADGVLRIHDTASNRLVLRMHVGAHPTAMIHLPQSASAAMVATPSPFAEPCQIHELLVASSSGTIRFVEVSVTTGGAVTARIIEKIRITTDDDQQHAETWHAKHRPLGSSTSLQFRLFAPQQRPDHHPSRTITAPHNYILGLLGMTLFVINPATRTAVASLRIPPQFEGVHDIAFYPPSNPPPPDRLFAILSTFNATLILLQIPEDASVGLAPATIADASEPSVAVFADADAGVPPESSDHLRLPTLHWEHAFVNRWRCELPIVRISIVAVFEASINVLGQSLDRETKFLSADLTLPVSRKDIDVKALKLPVSFADHAKNCTFLTCVNGRFLVTAGTDGRLVVRNVAPLALQSYNPRDVRRDGAAIVVRHPSLTGGIATATVSLDGRHLVTVGGDASVIVWNYAPVSQVHRPTRTSAKWHTFSSAVGVCPKEIPQDPNEPLFFLQARRLQMEERDRNEHAGHRAAILAEVEKLREQLRVVRAENDLATPDEKVDLEGFLVERDLALFQQQVSAAIEEMRDKVKFADLMADYVTTTLKRQCWDSMQSKLTPLIGMSNPALRVYSQHQRVIDPSQTALLRKLKFLRRVEEVDRAARGVNELTGLVSHGTTHPQEDQDRDQQTRDGADVIVVNPLASKLTDLDTKPVPADVEYTEDVSPYLYRPLLTFTRQRAVTQMHLLEARIANIAREFNQRFNDLVAMKKNEIASIRERNLRCTQVCRELEQAPHFFTCEMSPEETPESLLTVQDAEVAADKSHDPTEKARLAREEAERERWRRQHGSDDSSERALKAWMDGRLEKEIKTLVIDVPKPEFAVEGNPKYVAEADWSDEQVAQYKEYEKKRAKREEEVAARRKLLQQELANLQKENEEAAIKFDMQLQLLLLIRLRTSQRIFEVDLQRVKLVQSVALFGDRAAVLRQLEKKRTMLNSKLVRACQVTARFRQELSAKEEQLAQLVSKEKAAERGLRTMKPFNENEEAADRLAKMYAAARRKVQQIAAGGREGRSQKSRTKLAQVEDPLALSRASLDPFGFLDAEQEVKLKSQSDEAQTTATQFARLDRSTAGEIVSDALWEEFQRYLQDRLDGERQIRRLQQQVTDMAAEEQRLAETEERLRAEAIRAAEDLEHFRIEARDEAYDVDELRLYRQGQVEVTQAPVVTDYADAILIHVRDIHALNEAIRRRGRKKVELLKGLHEQRAESRYIEWEIGKLQYQCESLELECRHLHTLRVTKQMQEFIHGGGEGYNERERAKLAAKIEHVRATMSVKIEEKKHIMSTVKRGTREREAETSLLLEQVNEAESLVESRRAVRVLQSAEQERDRHARLMRDMRVTRKLEDVAKAQQEEMTALRQEIDRLRERTFPSFAVVSKRVIGNPDER